jgi:hypothetical protein
MTQKNPKKTISGQSLTMSNYVVSEEVQSDRLIKALMLVSQDVTKAVIQKALNTHTPVILSDDNGNILRMDAKTLAREYGLDGFEGK